MIPDPTFKAASAAFFWLAEIKLTNRSTIGSDKDLAFWSWAD